MAYSQIATEDLEKKPMESDSEEGPECAVCLQPCVLPTRLPCRHIFCFLCAKGLALQSRRCAMCRAEIPQDFIERPELLTPKQVVGDNEEVSGDNQQSEKSYSWFYEGRNGWWQYETRLSADLEAAYQRGERTHDALIAGSIYILDFNNWVQQRRDDPCKRRRIKRDLATSTHKGVAGIRQLASQNDNDESSGVQRPQVPHTHPPPHQHLPPQIPGAGGRVGLAAGAPFTSSYPRPIPRQSSLYALPDSSDSSSSSPDEDAGVAATADQIPITPGLGFREVASRAGAEIARAFLALTTSEPSWLQQSRVPSIQDSTQQPQHSTQLAWIPINNNTRAARMTRDNITSSRPVMRTRMHRTSSSSEDDPTS